MHSMHNSVRDLKTVNITLGTVIFEHVQLDEQLY